MALQWWTLVLGILSFLGLYHFFDVPGANQRATFTEYGLPTVEAFCSNTNTSCGLACAGCGGPCDFASIADKSKTAGFIQFAVHLLNFPILLLGFMGAKAACGRQWLSCKSPHGCACTPGPDNLPTYPSGGPAIPMLQCFTLMVLILPILAAIGPIMNSGNSEGKYLWYAYRMANDGEPCTQSWIDDQQRLVIIGRIFPFVGILIAFLIDWNLAWLAYNVLRELGMAKSAGPAV